MNLSDKHLLNFPPRAVCHLYGEHLYVGSCPMVEDGNRLAFPLETVAVSSGGHQLGLAIRRALDQSLQIVCHPRPKLGLLLTKTRGGHSTMENLAAAERRAVMVPAEGGMLSSAPRAEDAGAGANLNGVRGDPNALAQDVVEPFGVGRREASARVAAVLSRVAAVLSTKSAADRPRDFSARHQDLERSMEAWLLSEMIAKEHRSEFLFGAVGVVVELSDGAPTLMPIARRSQLADGRMWYGGKAPLRTLSISRGRIVEFRLKVGASDEELGYAVLAQPPEPPGRAAPADGAAGRCEGVAGVSAWVDSRRLIVKAGRAWAGGRSVRRYFDETA